MPCLVNPDRADIVADRLKGQNFVWIDLDRPSDADSRLAKTIQLHPLTLEDARTFDQRPKIEEYEGYVFMVVFGVDPDAESGDPLLREVHMIISGDYVVTIHHSPIDSLAELRTRYSDQPIRSEQFLVYKILDAVISTFVPTLSRVDDDIDDIEQQILDEAAPENLQRIFSLKRDLVAMRRVVTPMRNMMARDSDTIASLPGLESDDRLYFRDAYDGLVRTSELVDSYRDLLSGATDMYLSTVANRQGEVNKQLTVIATIFLGTPGRVAIGLVGLVNIFDPEQVVVSGGLVELDDVLLRPLRAAFDGRIEGAPYRPAVPIVAAELGGQPGWWAPRSWPGSSCARRSPRAGVKLGLTLPSFRDDVATSLTVAQAAEEHGLDGVFAYDHLFRRNAAGERRPAIEMFALMGAVAGATNASRWDRSSRARRSVRRSAGQRLRHAGTHPRARAAARCHRRRRRAEPRGERDLRARVRQRGRPRRRAARRRRRARATAGTRCGSAGPTRRCARSPPRTPTGGTGGAAGSSGSASRRRTSAPRRRAALHGVVGRSGRARRRRRRREREGDAPRRR